MTTDLYVLYHAKGLVITDDEKENEKEKDISEEEKSAEEVKTQKSSNEQEPKEMLYPAPKKNQLL